MSDAHTQQVPLYVVLEDTGTDYIAQPPGAQHVVYDEGAGLLHIIEGRMISSVPLPIEKIRVTPPPPSSSDPDCPSESAQDHRSETIEEDEEENEDKKKDDTVPDASNPSRQPLISNNNNNNNNGNGDNDESASTSSSDASSQHHAFLVSQGPPILSVQTSLDGSFTAIQRSTHSIEFLDHSNGNIFVETIPQKQGKNSSEFLGFFWTDAVDAEFVMVTSTGLELCTLHPGSSQRCLLQPTAFQKLVNVQWFLWSHSTRVLVLGCGSSGAKLQSFQLSKAGGVVRLALLDLTPPWGSPMKQSKPTTSRMTMSPREAKLQPISPVSSMSPRRQPRYEGGNECAQEQDYGKCTSPYETSPSSSISPSTTSLMVTPPHIWILMLYNCVIMAYHDRTTPSATCTATLKLYRLYRDATTLFAEVPMTTPGRIDLSIVDNNIIVIHDVQNGTAFVVDIAFSYCNMAKKSYWYNLSNSSVRQILPICTTPSHHIRVIMPASSSPSSQQHEETQGNLTLRLFHPNLALDLTTGHLYKVKIDLFALAHAVLSNNLPCTQYSSNRKEKYDIPRFLEFLKRRWLVSLSLTGQAATRHYEDPRHVALHVIRHVVTDSVNVIPLADLRHVFDALYCIPVTTSPTTSTSSRATTSQVLPSHTYDSAFIDVKDIALGILAPLLSLPSSSTNKNEGSNDKKWRYVEGALVELIASYCQNINGNNTRLFTDNNNRTYNRRPYIDAEVVELYMRVCRKRTEEKKDTVVGAMLERYAEWFDSLELAGRLESNAQRQSDITLALDMYRRLKAYPHVRRILLQYNKNGNIVQALKEEERGKKLDDTALFLYKNAIEEKNFLNNNDNNMIQADVPVVVRLAIQNKIVRLSGTSGGRVSTAHSSLYSSMDNTTNTTPTTARPSYQSSLFSG